MTVITHVVTRQPYNRHTGIHRIGVVGFMKKSIKNDYKTCIFYNYISQMTTSKLLPRHVHSAMHTICASRWLIPSCWLLIICSIRFSIKFNYYFYGLISSNRSILHQSIESNHGRKTDFLCFNFNSYRSKCNNLLQITIESYCL